MLEISLPADGFEGDIEAGSFVGLYGGNVLKMFGFAYAWLPGVAVEVVGCNVEIGMLVLRDGDKFSVWFGSDEVFYKMPILEEPANSAMFTRIPGDKGSYKCTQKTASEDGRIDEMVELLVDIFWIFLFLFWHIFQGFCILIFKVSRCQININLDYDHFSFIFEFQHICADIFHLEVGVKHCFFLGG